MVEEGDQLGKHVSTESHLLEYKIENLGKQKSGRRISSMRLIKILPEAKEKFESGSVKIENKSQMECEREFARFSPEIVKIQESRRALTSDFGGVDDGEVSMIQSKVH